MVAERLRNCPPGRAGGWAHGAVGLHPFFPFFFSKILDFSRLANRKQAVGEGSRGRNAAGEGN